MEYINDKYDYMQFVHMIMDCYSPITVDSKPVRISKQNVLLQHYNTAVGKCVGKNILRDLGENSVTRVFAALQIVKAIAKIAKDHVKEKLEDEIATPTKKSTTTLSTQNSSSKTTSYRLKPNPRKKAKLNLSEEFVASGSSSKLPNASTPVKEECVDTDEEAVFNDCDDVIVKTDKPADKEPVDDTTSVAASSADTQVSVDGSDSFGTLSVARS